MTYIASRLPDLVTVFLGIFVEAGPFLLLGVLVSSVLDVAVSTERLARVFPRSGVLSLLGGVAVGAATPLCECGTVPIARGSVSKGLPLPAAVGFLLAAPVINPITVAATYTAFKDDLRVLVLRVVLGVAVALAVGALFLLWPRRESPLRIGPQVSPHPPTPSPMLGEGEIPHKCFGTSPLSQSGRGVGGEGTLAPKLYDEHPDHEHSFRVPGTLLRPQEHEHTRSKTVAILDHAGHELTSLMVYLVAASLVAALLQVFLPRPQLVALGQGPLLSVAIMLVIAVVLSTCSSVDAFVALAFSTTFAPGAILAFLLISPVLNLKSGALVVGVFRPRVAIPLLSAATATVVLAALAVNYHLL